MRKNNKLLLHIGCGNIDRPYFTNVDARNLPHIHHVTNDITNLSFIEDNSADLIYACHVIEHISWHRQPYLFEHFFKKLKSGGILRLAAPDFDKIVRIYTKAKKNLSTIMGPLFGGQDYIYNFHNCTYNYSALKGFFSEVGFVKIKKWNPKKVEYHDFKDTSTHPVSINLQGIKP